MHTVSFAKKTLNITVHNQYPSLELMPPVYFSASRCHVFPSQQTDTSTIIEASLGMDSKHEFLKGALLYKLQRKHVNGTDNQSDNSIASIKDVTTNVHLLVVWDVKEFRRTFRACLIECTDDFTWDEDKLWILRHYYGRQINGVYKYSITNGTITWLLNSKTVLKTKLDVIYGSDCKLTIVISEGTGKNEMSEPIQVDQGRLVLSLLVMISLMYAARLYNEPSVKLNIHNQCLNIDLISPVYTASDGTECHKPPNHKVCAGDSKRSGFIGMLHNVSYGILIYKPQRKQLHESTEIGEDTLGAAHLLVTWRIESEVLYADVLLVEHDKGFDWNEDDLRSLSSGNIFQFRLCPDSAKETWLLDDNTALMTAFEIKKNRLVNVTISEVEGYNCARMLVHIDQEK
jgi:hypothetical protein